ncbi:MAG TPA: NAD-dependent epimerase/dehydratase family protein [Hyphomicrobium sp.]|nr:NAD-dependent epimerase/dehydratase family protein [Hyphomicrobium sp.]
MRILILGAGGFLAGSIGTALAVAGHTAIGLSRKPPSDLSDFEAHFAADRGDTAAVLAAIDTHGIDTVIDLLAFTKAQTFPLLAALEGRIARYVLISSCDVYHRYGLLQRTERGAFSAEPISESAPLRSAFYPYRGVQPRPADDPARWLDDYDKIPIESRVAVAEGFDGTILRLPMVFGPGDRQRRFRWIIEPMARNAAAMTVPRAWADWRTCYGYVEDVAAGIALASVHPGARRRVFNLGLEDTPAHREWIARFAALCGWCGEIVDDRGGATPLSQLAEQLDLSVPLVLSTERIRGELGYRETVDMQTALRRTFDDEVRRGWD